MKWYQAFAKGAGDQYLSVRDQEREHVSRMAQIREQMNVDLAKQNAKDAKKYNMKFGEYVLKDREQVPGDMWTNRENRLKDFDAFLRDSFFDNGTFNPDTYNNFKDNDKANFQNMVDEYDTRIGQFLYPKDRTITGQGGSDEVTREEYNTYESNWLKDMPEFYDKAETYNVARDVSKVSAIEVGKNGKAIVNMFDVVQPKDNEKPIEARSPEELINNPNRETIVNIANEMETILTHSQYGGGKGGMFADIDDYRRKVLGTKEKPGGEFEHIPVIANIIWNARNKTGGLNKGNMNEELAQAQLYYGLSFKEMMSAYNQMMPKFEIIDQGEKRTIIRHKGLPTKDISAANQRLAANYRIGHLANRLIEAIDDSNRTGRMFKVDKALWGIFGEGGQWEQLKSTFGEWTSGSVAREYFNYSGKEGSALEEQKFECKSGYHCLWTDMKKMQNWDKGEVWRKDSQSVQEYLKITLAYSLALSEQGSGGGKAISDKDYENAYNRVGNMYGTVGQDKAILKDLLKTNKYDLTVSYIQTEEEFSNTSNNILKWFEGGYKEKFNQVVQRYTDKLAGNPVYGMVMEPVFDDKGNQLLGKSGKPIWKIKEGDVDVNGEIKHFKYDGRLSRLFQIDFGTNPDFSAEEGTQGLWDSLGEHEKLVLRGTDSFLEQFNSIFVKTKESATLIGDGTKTSETINQPDNQELKLATSSEITSQGEAQAIEQTAWEAELSKYQDGQWWIIEDNAQAVVMAKRDEIQEYLFKKVQEKYPSADFEQYGDRKYDIAFKHLVGLNTAGWGVFEDTEPREMWNRYNDLNKALKEGQKFLEIKEKSKKKD